jgi:hypothetical protein
MHTLHWLAVEAESKRGAEEKVFSFLNTQSDTWWDWHDESIGGRWSDNAHTTNAGDTEEYQKVLARIKESRQAEMTMLKDKLDLSELESAIDNYQGEDYISKDYLNFNFYRIKQALALLDGTEWSNNAYYYDTESWTSQLVSLNERVTNAPEKQYLVPIDFHF